MTDKEKIEKLLALTGFILSGITRVYSHLPKGSRDAKTLESIYAKIEQVVKETEA